MAYTSSPIPLKELIDATESSICSLYAINRFQPQAFIRQLSDETNQHPVENR